MIHLTLVAFTCFLFHCKQRIIFSLLPLSLVTSRNYSSPELRSQLTPAAMEAELQDWELLHNNNTDEEEEEDDYDVVTAPADDGFSRETDESESGIRSDYFALDSNYNNNNIPYAANSQVTTPQEEEFGDEPGSDQSDNPSWIDPSSKGITFETKDPGGGEFWSDSASDGSSSSVGERFEQGLECKHDLGFVDEVGVQGNHEKIVGSPEFWSDSGGDTGIEKDLGVSAESDGGEVGRGEFCSAGETGTENPEEIVSLSAQVVVNSGGDKRGGDVWWKLPLELLKFCAFRVSPVWSVSIAAAVVGLVILRRRLYKMKHQTRRIALHVALEDDKKVSQFMARAARLNEAFSVVKRVPMIRPSLPASGLTPWVVMSLR